MPGLNPASFLLMPFIHLRAEIPRPLSSGIRIEPRSRDDNFSLGLEASTADPLWMLGRIGRWGSQRGDPGRQLREAWHIVPAGDESGVAIRVDNDTGEGKRAIDMTTEREASLDWRRRVQIGQRYESSFAIWPETQLRRSSPSSGRRFPFVSTGIVVSCSISSPNVISVSSRVASSTARVLAIR